MSVRVKYNIIFSLLFFLGALLLFASMMPFCHRVFNPLIHAVPFINEKPVQYIFCVALALFFNLLIFKDNIYEIGFTGFMINLFFLAAWLILSCIFGGILWAYHDMGNIGYIGPYPSFLSKALKNISEAFYWGPVVLLFDIPFNILCIALFFLLKKWLKNKFNF